MAYTAVVLVVGMTRHRASIANAAGSALCDYQHRNSPQSALAFLRAYRADVIILAETLDPLLRTLVAMSARHRYPRVRIMALVARSETLGTRSKLDEVLDADDDPAEIAETIEARLGAWCSHCP
jgi:hypothetical protein